MKKERFKFIRSVNGEPSYILDTISHRKYLNLATITILLNEKEEIIENSLKLLRDILFDEIKTALDILEDK